MARLARVVIPNLPHHVIQRGVRSLPIKGLSAVQMGTAAGVTANTYDAYGRSKPPHPAPAGPTAMSYDAASELRI